MDRAVRARDLMTASLSRLSRLRARVRGSRVALSAGATILAILVAGVSVVALRPALSASASRMSASPSPTAMVPVEPVASPQIDLRPFREAARKPAAAAPIKKLPKVDPQTVMVSGIPPVAMQAYRNAAQQLARTAPGCHIAWWLVAGIGFVESGHAASGGSHQAGWSGVARPPIYGPVLNGSHGYLPIRDTDNGAYDGDRRWDRAVGPMQFLPSTWRSWGPHVGSGLASPQNIRAAATATAGYLCAGGLDLSQPRAMALAVYSYNHSFDYVRLVLSVAARYAGSTPDELGVNLLPRDHPHKKHHGRHHHARHRSAHHRDRTGTSGSGGDSGAGATSSGATPTASPSPSAAPTSSPAPAPTTEPIPTTLPTLLPQR